MKISNNKSMNEKGKRVTVILSKMIVKKNATVNVPRKR